MSAGVPSPLAAWSELDLTPWPAERVAVDPHLSLTVRQTPAAEGTEPAVMVHGLGGSSLNWTGLMARLSDRLATRAPDLPGFGQSPPPHDGDYSVAALAASVIGLLEVDRRGPVHLVGNSLGGLVATSVAALRPDLVRTLTLISPALPELVPGRWRLQVAAVGLPAVGPGIARKLLRLPPERRVAGTLQLVLARPQDVPDDWLAAAREDAVARASLPYAADALARASRSVLVAYVRHHRELWRRARSVQAPTLLVWGAQDRLVPLDTERRARSAFAGSRSVVLPQSGHVAHMEQPALLDRLIREHLDSAVEPAAPPATVRLPEQPTRRRAPIG